MKALERLITGSVAAVIRYPLFCVLCLFCATAASLWQLQHLSFDSSAESFLKADDPQRLHYLEFENKYGLSAYFIVLVSDDQLFTRQGVARLRQLHQALEQNVANLERVESLINARFISSEGDDILIEPFLPDEALSEQQLLKKRQQAINTPYYLNRLVNAGGDSAGILLILSQYDARQQRLNMEHVQAVMADVRAVLQAQQTHYPQDILLGGSPVIGAELTKTTQQEMLLFSLLAGLIVAVMLFIVFRRVSAVLLPLICLFASIVMVLALMAGLQFSVQVSSVILPSFLMAVGVADAVHFLRAFYPALQQKGQVKAAVMYAIDHTGVAMFFSTLTTSVGLLSFATSNVTSIASFGIFSAAGVWLAFFLTVLCLPAMLMLLPLKAGVSQSVKQGVKAQQFVRRYVAWIYRHAIAVTLSGVLLLFGSIALASQLVFSLNMLEWFDKTHPMRIANEQIEQRMAGTMQIEMLITDAQHPHAPLSLPKLQQVDHWLAMIMEQQASGVPISSSVSVLNLLKEANQVLQPEAGYSLPDSQELLAQQLLLLQFDPDNSLAKVMNSDMSEIRITLSIPWQDSLEYSDFVHELSDSFYQHTGKLLRLDMTGMATLSNKAFTEMTHSMLVSYINASIAILLLLMLLVRKAGLGLAAMILPNVLPVAMVLAVMQLLNIPLDMFTMLIGSIAIGLIVDDTIHLLYTFQRYHQASGNALQAMADSLLTTGRALLSTTLVLCFAFLIYCLSSLSNLTTFGSLTALCIALALVADLVLLPAILLLLYHNKNKNDSANV